MVLSKRKRPQPRTAGGSRALVAGRRPQDGGVAGAGGGDHGGRVELVLLVAHQAVQAGEDVGLYKPSGSRADVHTYTKSSNDPDGNGYINFHS